VRINEPFGDVVNWDLLPQSAISSIQLVPGSNPAFGLNTLGGALAVYTKSGSQYPGGAVEAYAGSYGRKGGEFEYGGKNGNFDYFVTGNYMDDNGWAEHNPSTVRQFFGKVGWQDDKTDFDVSLTIADIDAAGFAVALIPHTIAATTFRARAPVDPVNLEVDTIARYVERLLATGAGPAAR